MMLKDKCVHVHPCRSQLIKLLHIPGRRCQCYRPRLLSFGNSPSTSCTAILAAFRQSTWHSPRHVDSVNHVHETAIDSNFHCQRTLDPADCKQFKIRRLFERL